MKPTKRTTKPSSRRLSAAAIAAGAARARWEQAVADCERAHGAHKRAVKARDTAREVATLFAWADAAILAVRAARDVCRAEAKGAVRGR